jgi:sugar phosphate isomerase/epimerase
MNSKLGLVSVSFRQLSVLEIIKLIKAEGMSLVEWGSDVHAPKDDIEKLEQIAELQKEYGIKCSSYGTYFKVGTTPIEELESYIKAAKILGTNVLRIWCGDKDSENYSESEKQKLFEECEKLSEIAEQNGVVLCLECHGWTYTNRLSSALEVMEAVNSDNFKMYWQPNQFRTYEENLEYAEKIAKYTVNIHVFNWLGEDKFPLIEAKEKWQEYLKKFSGNENLLLEFMPDGKPESLTTEYAALKEIVGV